MGDNSLNAISPIDGRYAAKLTDLKDYFSESAFFKYRIKVEVDYLLFLSKIKIIRKLSESETRELKHLYEGFDTAQAQLVKEIEELTNHDVKAVEYYIQKQIIKSTLNDISQYIHFGLTSEDANNIAYSLMITDFVKTVYLPTIKKLITQLIELTNNQKANPILARTHGQPASPTTLGKEFAVFLNRLTIQLENLVQITLTAKLNGATGNFNAHIAAYPEENWIEHSTAFIKSFGLEPNGVTTQIEPNDNLAKLFHNIMRINNIILELDQDCWYYISQQLLILKPVKNEVGSSTMPHKINPIDFENSEGNLGIANALLYHLCQTLTVSRLQRDLSGSTAKRNIGVPLAHTILAYKSTLKGLSKIDINPIVQKNQLHNHPEVLAEAIQTILRKNQDPKAYERLKELTRGKTITLAEIQNFIKNLNIEEEDKTRLLELTPESYIGMAEQLAGIAVKKAKKILEVI
ncbi:adenylosuccinate lyase [Candidatus Woesearchaeota archaeon]|nr:adenylosuccinate lyase [Candidatus Woesearchaeota archaeon]